MNPDEREIIRRALRGDDEAFESVIRSTGRKIYALAYGILQDAAEAEDVAQETFLKAHRHRWLLRDPEKFPAWLFAVARNRSLDMLRRRRLRPLPLENLEDAGHQEECASLRPYDPQEHEGRLEEIRLALAALPEHHRTALTLRYLENLDAASIEQVMGITNGALRGILGRSLASMRKSLQPSTL
jgi:RNA polymerase sigma-70 factor (ECF subfamily)